MCTLPRRPELDSGLHGRSYMNEILNDEDFNVTLQPMFQKDVKLFGLPRHFVPRNDVKKKSFFSRFAFHKFAFTLAEVLIVLGIIGVVAEMTIPTLMNETGEKEKIVALKKAFSTISQAYTMSVNENGTPDEWGLSNMADASQPGSKVIIDKLAPYLRVQKSCGVGSGCFAVGPYKRLKNTDSFDPNSNTETKILLADGVSMTAWSGWTNCDGVFPGASLAMQNVCGSVEVDINGFKKPNQDGVDYFVFWLTKYGIVPNGIASMPSSNGNSFDLSCAAADGSGHGCTAWAIYNENMDYLHCNNLSWSGPTKCN